MKRVRGWIRHFIMEEDAPTMMEYGLLVILIAFVAIVGVTLLGQAVGGLFQTGASGFP